MRVRENRKTMRQSLSTAVRLKNRAQLLRHISGRLGKAAGVTDDMIHVTHYGYDDRIDWDEYIIVVEGHGVFGFADGPCPDAASDASTEAEPLREVEAAFAGSRRRRLESRGAPAARGLRRAAPEKRSKSA